MSVFASTCLLMVLGWGVNCTTLKSSALNARMDATTDSVTSVSVVATGTSVCLDEAVKFDARFECLRLADGTVFERYVYLDDVDTVIWSEEQSVATSIHECATEAHDEAGNYNVFTFDDGACQLGKLLCCARSACFTVNSKAVPQTAFVDSHVIRCDQPPASTTNGALDKTVTGTPHNTILTGGVSRTLDLTTDGSLATYYQSEVGLNSWIQVDLGQIYPIWGYRIATRNDEIGVRFREVTVGTSLDEATSLADVEHFEEEATIAGPPTSIGQAFEETFSTARCARYVSLRREPAEFVLSVPVPSLLEVAEFEVLVSG